MEGTLVPDAYSGYVLRTMPILLLTTLLWKSELLQNTWSEQARGTESTLTAWKRRTDDLSPD